MDEQTTPLVEETAPHAQTAPHAEDVDPAETAPHVESQATQAPQSVNESQATPLAAPDEPCQQFRMKLQIRRSCP